MTNRVVGGRTYKDLKKALDRLAGTRITTNIQYTENKSESAGFGLIDSWHIVEEKKGRKEIGMIEVTLPEWLYAGIKKTQVLKISQDYFRIRKAMDRRVYEIARKHCGKQLEFKISIKKLYSKTGSTSTLRLFKFNIKQLTKTNDLPDYEISYDDNKDMVIFTNRNPESENEKIVKFPNTTQENINAINQELLQLM